MQSLLKFLLRLGDYSRGLKLMIVIKLCGGECLGIPKVGKGVIFKYPPHKGISIGKNCDIGSFSHFDIPPKGRLKLGNNVKLTHGIIISSINSVSIGNNCLIAEWTSIRDAQHKYNRDQTINKQSMKAGYIDIKEDVWIARNCSIFLNTVIHNGAIIGANSMVKNTEVPSMTIYAGIPAIYIKDR